MLGASELAANADLHGGGVLAVTARRDTRRRRLLISVRDAGALYCPAAAASAAGDGCELAEHGRGLDIIHALSDASGWDRIDGTGETLACARLRW
ncbi:hypothetical protein [Streptomyces sp. SM12]|uniref:hypothetical protein n=1 Tax=Streptomyces sp. SM12 TaxID=1071602 RepID=UPI000CD58B8A|nr:hypothetical protein [Streptomyces sp. SM12]